VTNDKSESWVTSETISPTVDKPWGYSNIVFIPLPSQVFSGLGERTHKQSYLALLEKNKVLALNEKYGQSMKLHENTNVIYNPKSHLCLHI
jgi:hypothetical protein